ncbi:uncharacterized protein LOC131597432 [Vicia villosa]|uniref:uncharacterized protein LOC131597432 n=1 Tax=Vicia villosa TaxID=3911 RepID=UPI00273B39B9|nr:uncharacterized protein LOC131597432 [Vicia villosa]
MEYLNRVLLDVRNNRTFKFHPKCAKLLITNLCFANDILLFAKGDTDSVRILMSKIKAFSTATGLTISIPKSKVYCGGVDETICKNILEATGFGRGSLPFKYLGVPLDSKKLTINSCKPLIDRMLSRINHWSAKLLSYAGRMLLVKSVMFAIANYWMQVFLLPKKVLQHIESLCKRFLWTSKEDMSRKAPISWDQESVTHLCFECDQTKYVWTHMFEWLATQKKPLNGRVDIDWFIHMTKG